MPYLPDPRDFLPPPPWKGPPLPEAFLRAFSLTPERIALVQTINNQIRQRTKYGTRQEVVERAPGYVLTWSNGSAAWYTSWARKRGETATLDANEVLVQGVKKADLEAILRWLEPLPLYAYSYEAKERGFFDLFGWLKTLLEGWKEEQGGQHGD